MSGEEVKEAIAEEKDRQMRELLREGRKAKKFEKVKDEETGKEI